MRFHGDLNNEIPPEYQPTQSYVFEDTEIVGDPGEPEPNKFPWLLLIAAGAAVYFTVNG